MTIFLLENKLMDFNELLTTWGPRPDNRRLAAVEYVLDCMIDILLDGSTKKFIESSLLL